MTERKQQKYLPRKYFNRGHKIWHRHPKSHWDKDLWIPEGKQRISRKKFVRKEKRNKN